MTVGTFGAFIAASIYAHYARQQVREVQIQNLNAQRALQITQRAYVTLGRADGVLMEWEPLKQKAKGVVKIYFQNTGYTAASEFYVNTDLKVPEDYPEQIGDWLKENRWIGGPGRQLSARHIRPISSKVTLITQIIGAHSSMVSRAQTRRDLTPRTIRRIKNGRSQVEISGTFEYLDIFGGYCCQNFEAAYVWSSDEFVRLPPIRDNCPKDPPSVCSHAVPLEAESAPAPAVSPASRP